MEDIKVWLTSQEIKEFKLWRQYQTIFQQLQEAGVFNIQGGKAILNFTPDGRLLHIKVYQYWQFRKNQV